MEDCLETCQIGVDCPHNMDCDHVGSGRLIQEAILFGDDLDKLMEEYGEIFPSDWDSQDFMNFCARWVIANIDDIKEYFED